MKKVYSWENYVKLNQTRNLKSQLQQLIIFIAFSTIIMGSNTLNNPFLAFFLKNLKSNPVMSIL